MGNQWGQESMGSFWYTSNQWGQSESMGSFGYTADPFVSWYTSMTPSFATLFADHTDAPARLRRSFISRKRCEGSVGEERKPKCS
jgi:hypothetical protein